MKHSNSYDNLQVEGGGTERIVNPKLCSDIIKIKNISERGRWKMKKIIITIIMFAITIGMIIGIIVPIANHGRSTGQTANTRMSTIDGEISTMMQPIN
jgi:hypothetical protein